MKFRSFLRRYTPWGALTELDPGPNGNDRPAPGYERRGANQVQWDPFTFRPIGTAGPPAHEVALQYQYQADTLRDQRFNALYNDAYGALAQGNELLAGYRPGGSASLASGLLQNRASLLATQANALESPDLMSAYREDKEIRAERAAKKAARVQMLMGAAQMAAGAIGGSPAAVSDGAGNMAVAAPGMMGPPAPGAAQAGPTAPAMMGPPAPESLGTAQAMTVATDPGMMGPPASPGYGMMGPPVPQGYGTAQAQMSVDTPPQHSTGGGLGGGGLKTGDAVGQSGGQSGVQGQAQQSMQGPAPMQFGQNGDFTERSLAASIAAQNPMFPIAAVFASQEDEMIASRIIRARAVRQRLLEAASV